MPSTLKIAPASSKTKRSHLPVTMDILAGDAPAKQLARGCAARIMTGAPIPTGATAVIPVEDTDDALAKG